MKIIKKGDVNLLKITKRFICEKCGCEFEADINEYKIGEQYNQEYYYCDCPTCFNTVYKE